MTTYADFIEELKGVDTDVLRLMVADGKKRIATDTHFGGSPRDTARVLLDVQAELESRDE